MLPSKTDHPMEVRKTRTSHILLFFLFCAAASSTTSAARSPIPLPPLKHRRLHLSSYPDFYFSDSPVSIPPYSEITPSPSPSSQRNTLDCTYPPPEPSPPPPPPPIISNPNPNPPPTPDCAPIPDYSLSPPNYPLTPDYPLSPPHYPIFPPDYPLSPPNYPLTPDYPFTPPHYPLLPPDFSLSPPNYPFTPPDYSLSPPDYPLSPPIYAPSPPIYLPPVIYPPPIFGERNGLWCVVKPSVPEPIIQEAMDYACSSGADCQAILPSGSCFEPDSVIAHASYAFNSYWQRTRAAGGTCDFGGTAMLVTKDPSYDGCQFINIMLQ